MPWTPTPPGLIPDPDAIKAWLDPEAGEGMEGFITPDDIKDVVQALASMTVAVGQDAITHTDEEVAAARALITPLGEQVIQNTNVTGVLAQEVGNIHLLGTRDVVEAIMSLAARVAALEALDITPPPPALPTSEGLLEVDKYSGTYARARATTVDLSDMNEHWFTFALATVAGVGGETFDGTAGLFQLGGVVWFEQNGALGHVKAVSGSDLASTACSNYITGNRLCRGRLDMTDPAHPGLILLEVLS
jgi:hypothetical protein